MIENYNVLISLIHIYAKKLFKNKKKLIELISFNAKTFKMKANINNATMSFSLLIFI